MGLVWMEDFYMVSNVVVFWIFISTSLQFLYMLEFSFEREIGRESRALDR